MYPDLFNKFNTLVLKLSCSINHKKIKYLLTWHIKLKFQYLRHKLNSLDNGTDLLKGRHCSVNGCTHAELTSAGRQRKTYILSQPQSAVRNMKVNMPEHLGTVNNVVTDLVNQEEAVLTKMHSCTACQ